MTPRWIVLAALLASCATPTQRLEQQLKREQKSAVAKGKPILDAEVAALGEPLKLGCNAEIQSYNHLVCCDHVKEVLKPTSVKEVEKMVKDLADAGHHLRVVGRMHSSNKQLCPPDDEYVMSLEHLTGHMHLRHHAHEEVVVADAGMTLRDFDQLLYDEGRSIGLSVIGFRGVSLGGAVATGAHGSSLTEKSVLSERVVYVEIVEPDGQLHKYWRDELEKAGQGDRFRALSASMGLLGVVVKVGFKTEPRFNLTVHTSFDEEKVLFEKGVEHVLDGCDFAQVVWFPRANRIMRICGNRTGDDAQPGASSILLSPGATPYYVKTFRSLIETTIRNGAERCDIEYERYLNIKQNPPYVQSCCCKTRSAATVTGPSHLMLSSDLTAYHDQLPEIDFELAVPKSRWAAALDYLNRQIDKDELCLPLIGVFLRFSDHDESTLIGHASQPEPVMFVEIVVYVRQSGQVGPDQDYYQQYYALAANLVDAFGARPHWGKNDVSLFDAQRKQRPVEEALGKFRAIRRAVDPKGLFVNPFAIRAGLAD